MTSPYLEELKEAKSKIRELNMELTRIKKALHPESLLANELLLVAMKQRAEKAEAAWQDAEKHVIEIAERLTREQARVAKLEGALASVVEAYGKPGPLPELLAQAFHAQHGAEATCELCEAREREAR